MYVVVLSFFNFSISFSFLLEKGTTKIPRQISKWLTFFETFTTFLKSRKRQ